MTHCLWGSLDGRGVTSMRRADWRTLEGMRLSWRAWKPAQPRRVVCWEVKRRRSLAMFSSGYSALMGCCLVAATCAMVCWQMALWDGQCFFWHSGDCHIHHSSVCRVRCRGKGYNSRSNLWSSAMTSGNIEFRSRKAKGKR